jgi:hypothetical protein
MILCRELHQLNARPCPRLPVPPNCSSPSLGYQLVQAQPFHAPARKWKSRNSAVDVIVSGIVEPSENATVELFQ